MDLPRTIPDLTNQVLLGGKFKLIAGRLYHEGNDKILRLCIEPSEQGYYLEQAHKSALGIHSAGQQTAQALMRLGIYWPSMRQDAFSYVHNCDKCRAHKPVSYGTLYHIMIAPQWSQYIVDYLQTHILPANISLARKRAIEIEARNYTLIGNQLYHRGKDQQLWLCVT